MKAIVLDREERTVRIESVSRKGNVVFRNGGEYAMRGVSWAWGRPAYPRLIFAAQFIPFVGPFIARSMLLGHTTVFIATGSISVLEPEGPKESGSIMEPKPIDLGFQLTDEQALKLMEAHAEASSIGRKSDMGTIVLLGAFAIAGLSILALILG